MSKSNQKVISVVGIIENMYVDKIDDQQFSEDVIKAIVEKLDPHSVYIPADEAREMNEPLEGNFDGIGIAFQIKADTVYVIETISGGPAEKVGMRPGDKLIYVDADKIAGVKMSTKDIMSRLKGPKGSKVQIQVYRNGQDDLISFNITRDKIPIYSLDAAYMLDKTTGYIRLSRFGVTTTQEFLDARAKLQKQGMKDLVLDLQSNGGGYMSAAIDILNDLLPADRMIVYTQGDNQPKREYTSKGKGLLRTGRLVVLIDGYSASASEIVSGAIQDWDRGVIVGRRSFGKGLVQQQIPFNDQSLLRLTVARYYTPTGRSIQKPYQNGDAESYNMDVVERYNKGEMLHADSIHFPDSLAYKTLVNERTVYGGGGIMPDYYVPVDTTGSSQYYAKLYYAGVINTVSLNELDHNRETLLKKYPNIDIFREQYEVSEDLLQKVIAEAEKLKIEFNQEEYDISKFRIVKSIRLSMARNLYDTEAYFRILNDESDIFQKGLEIIKDDKLYQRLLKPKQ